MRSWLALMVIVTFCISGPVDAQTNPLWSERKVKNFLPHMTWPEVRDLLSRTDMVLIPIPALEQHGLQGPIGTDYYTGVEQSKLIAQRTDILVAPILLVGQSPYHLAFPGSIALSAETPRVGYRPDCGSSRSCLALDSDVSIVLTSITASRVLHLGGETAANPKALDKCADVTDVEIAIEITSLLGDSQSKIVRCLDGYRIHYPA